jgi:hypothetical protein
MLEFVNALVGLLTNPVNCNILLLEYTNNRLL